MTKEKRKEKRKTEVEAWAIVWKRDGKISQIFYDDGHDSIDRALAEYELKEHYIKSQAKLQKIRITYD